MSVVNIKPAASGMNSHSYRPISLLTLDFGELVASRVIECNDSDNFTKIACKGRLRLAPQVFPAYGECELRTAAFFVPEYQLTQQSEAFHSNMNSFKGKSVVMPWIYKWEINMMFSENSTGVNPLCGLVYTSFTMPNTTTLPDEAFDFVWLANDSGNPKYCFYRLTKLGQVYYKILKSLGYDWFSLPPFGGASYSDYMSSLAIAAFKRNVLPLLAYAKVYTDMFLNSHFYNTDELVSFLHHVHDVDSFTPSGGTIIYYGSTGQLTWQGIEFVLYHVSVPHERNMYLDAWNSPNSPTGISPATQMLAENPSGPVSPYLQPFNGISSEVHADDDLTLIQTPSAGSSMVALSTFGLNTLEAFYKFVKRNNLFGSKAVQRVLARFGVKSDDYNSHYVHKLYEGRSPIDFSAVMSNTDNYVAASSGSPASGKTLAAYAGFGVGGLNYKFNYRASEFGYIIVLHWIQCIPILLHGDDPSVLRLNPFDWYTPEYDGKTIRAIPQSEVSICHRSNDISVNGDDKVYGFTDIYDDYRNLKDSVVGDFIVSQNARNFFFGRDLSYFRSTSPRGKMSPQSGGIQYFDKSGNPDMTNPFQESYSNGDRFYLSCQFDIKAKRSVMSKSQALDLNGEGDLKMPLGGTEAH